MHYNRSSLKPAIWLRIARPMCDGRPFASSLFRRLVGRGSFFCGFPFRRAVQFAPFLDRCLTLQDAAPCYGKDSLHECGRPHDTLSCLFFTAKWLRQKSTYIDAGTANQRYRFDLLQDVADQVRYMLTSGALVPWVAGGSTCRIWSIQSFTFPWRSQWWTSGWRSSSFSTLTLEARCSSTTSNTTR